MRANDRVQLLNTKRTARFKREAGGALYPLVRLALTQPFGGNFDRDFFFGGLSCIKRLELGRL
jgi:hypothetical protein